MTGCVEISVIVPVSGRHDDSGDLILEYLESLNTYEPNFELLYVLDGRFDELLDRLTAAAASEPRLRIIQLSKKFGESTALAAGFDRTSGKKIVTLPAYYQVEPCEIGRIISDLDEHDVSVAVRWPRARRSRFESFRRNAFHWIVRAVTGENFNDLGCSARAMRRDVLNEIPIYGDQHRFLGLLAIRRGYRVNELQVRQSDKDWFAGHYGPKFYLRRLLDILTVVFLVRFTKKPLRFFGMIGIMTLLFGAAFLMFVVVERIFFGMPLADRPALLLSSLLVVLGLQLLALGLIGELIIFTHARDIKEYSIQEIIN